MVMQLSEKKKLIAATVQHCADSWLQANPGGSQPQQASPEHAQQGREATKKDGSAARAACRPLHAGNGGWGLGVGLGGAVGKPRHSLCTTCVPLRASCSVVPGMYALAS